MLIDATSINIGHPTMTMTVMAALLPATLGLTSLSFHSVHALIASHSFQGDDDVDEEDVEEQPADKGALRATVLQMRQQNLTIEEMEAKSWFEFDPKMRQKGARWSHCLVVAEHNPLRKIGRTHMCTRQLSDGSICCHGFKLQVMSGKRNRGTFFFSSSSKLQLPCAHKSDTFLLADACPWVRNQKLKKSNVSCHNKQHGELSAGFKRTKKGNQQRCGPQCSCYQ